jgi:hypothetical protein
MVGYGFNERNKIMSKDGLAVAPQGTTSAPKGMYREEEQDETVARGCVRITEVIAYDATKTPRRYPPEEPGIAGAIMTDRSGKTLYVENSRGPYFYQDSEDFVIFKENNPNARLETFGIQVLRSTAVKYINRPENIEQFTRKGAK